MSALRKFPPARCAAPPLGPMGAPADEPCAGALMPSKAAAAQGDRDVQGRDVSRRLLRSVQAHGA